MNKVLTCFLVAMISFSASAEHHSSAEAEVRVAIKAFNDAYANNNVDDYFGYYDADATVYFFGARQDISAYHEEWTETISAGGGVEKNELSDIQVQVMPSSDVAVATYFVDYRMRAPDGEISVAKAFETEVWQKIEGEWRVVSLHYSEISAEE